MPSGAKKRKAAKKKKEKEANITESATHSQQGDDDLKTHDEKESDGEVSSPTSQDHHNDQHPFAEGEEEELEKRENASSARSFVTEMKPIEAVNNDGESTQKVAIEEAVVQIDSNLKPEDDSIVEKNIVVMESGELKEGAYNSRELTEGAYNSVSESATFVDSVKLVDSLSEVVTKVTDSVPVGEAYNSVVETATFVDSDKVSLSEEMVQVTESESVENFVTSDVVELGLKENGKKMLPSEDESTGVSSVMTDLGSQNKEDKVVSTPNENAAASSNAMGFAAQENEDKLLVSFNASRVDTNNGAEHIKTSGIPESSDSQTQVASAPQAVQTTSWRSCCGLFEVLTGSNR
uniref:Putative enolase-phosphatase E1 n=1 Tax=Davidia involucrata TaxID=16924 RepID=A0A5B6Z640_DAVIN